MTAPWVLLLQPSESDAARKVGGLALALRLALDAQSAGFSCVIDDTRNGEVARALSDKRLHIPTVTEPPTGAQIVSVPSHWLMHRSTFATLITEAPPEPRIIDIATVDIQCKVPWGFNPIAVIDRATARVAERLLFRSLRKVQDGWTSRWLNRYLSLFMSRWLVNTPFTPNQISVVILAIGLFGAYCASRGTYWSLAIGSILFQMQSVLDGCDGEVSRVTYRGSKAGEWFDTIGDDLTNYSFFAAAAFGIFHTKHQAMYLTAGAITIACGLLSSGLEYRYLIRIGSGDLLKYPLSQATTAPSRGIGRLAPLLKRDTFVFLTMLAALFNQVGVALLIFALGAVGITVAVLKTELRLAHPSSVVR
jgi:phosphatidylglycerophosphate synthase